MDGARPPFRDVLIVTQYYAPEPGAPQIRLAALARELVKAGVRVRVLTGMPNYPIGRIFPEYRGKITASEEIEGVPVRRVWLYPATGRGTVQRLLNYLSFTAAVTIGLVFEPRSDLIFVEAQPLTLGLPAWLTTRLRGIPYVYNTPDLQVEYAQEGRWLGSRWMISAAKRLESFLMKRSLTVTTVTHAFIRHFASNRGVSLSKLTFLPNGADIDRLRPLPRDHDYAKQLGVGDRKVFTYAGTHAPYQGLSVILEAARLLQHRDDVVILMVGNGPIRQELIDIAQRDGLHNVLFRDSPFDDMHRLMSITHASLVVLRDLDVANKMRLSKAIPPLACGVPVIFAGRGETASILEREGCGLVLEPERPELLARAIEQLADDDDLRREMAQRGRALAERDFSWRWLVRDWMRQVGCTMRGEPPDVPGLEREQA